MVRSNLGASLAVMVALCVALSSQAHAGSASSSLGVSVTVTSTCMITVDSLDFAAAAAQADGTASVSLACTKGASAAITLDQGENPALGSTDAAPSRRMVSGGGFLSYALYSDAARTTAWGNTVLTATSYVAASRQPVVMNVYGRIVGSAAARPGAYSDMVVATINF